MNPFDYSNNIKLPHGSSNVFIGELSDAAVDIAIVTTGFYVVSANVDFCVRGPTTATAAATAAASSMWWAYERPIVHCNAAEHLSIILASTAPVAGDYSIAMIQAGPRP